MSGRAIDVLQLARGVLDDALGRRAGRWAFASASRNGRLRGSTFHLAEVVAKYVVIDMFAKACASDFNGLSKKSVPAGRSLGESNHCFSLERAKSIHLMIIAKRVLRCRHFHFVAGLPGRSTSGRLVRSCADHIVES